MVITITAWCNLIISGSPSQKKVTRLLVIASRKIIYSDWHKRTCRTPWYSRMRIIRGMIYTIRGLIEMSITVVNTDQPSTVLQYPPYSSATLLMFGDITARVGNYVVLVLFHSSASDAYGLSICGAPASIESTMLSLIRAAVGLCGVHAERAPYGAMCVTVKRMF